MTKYNSYVRKDGMHLTNLSFLSYMGKGMKEAENEFTYSLRPLHLRTLINSAVVLIISDSLIRVFMSHDKDQLKSGHVAIFKSQTGSWCQIH